MKFKEMNTPNKLTTIRMACVPLVILLFALFMFNKNDIFTCDVLLFGEYYDTYLTLTQLLIVLLFAFASITDYIDGHMARRLNIVSNYGKMMDPLADKLLVNSTLICMLASHMFFLQEITTLSIVAMIFVVITIARDIFVDALRMQALKSNVVVPAMIWGKLKTATLMPGIVITLLGSTHEIVWTIGLCMLILGGIFAIIGGIKYFKSMAKYIAE